MVPRQLREAEIRRVFKINRASKVVNDAVFDLLIVPKNRWPRRPFILVVDGPSDHAVPEEVELVKCGVSNKHNISRPKTLDFRRQVIPAGLGRSKDSVLPGDVVVLRKRVRVEKIPMLTANVRVDAHAERAARARKCRCRTRCYAALIRAIA